MTHHISDAEIARYAYQAGFRGPALTTAVAVALAESNGYPHARGDVGLQTGTWGPSIGLWQIRSLNSQHGTGGQRDAVANENPATNARHAFQISSGGHNWQPWSTYTNGAYRSYLHRAQLAARHARDGGHKHGGHRHGGQPHGGHKHGGHPHGATRRTGHGGQKGGYRVVLDLHELGSLETLCDTSRNRVEHSTRTVRDVAADLAGPNAYHPDRAPAINALLTSLADPREGLPKVARDIDGDAQLVHRIHQLARAVDRDDGRNGYAGLIRALRKAGPAAEAAVIEALRHHGLRTGHHQTPVRHHKHHKHHAPAHPQLPPRKHENTGNIVPASLARYHNGRIPASQLASVGDGEKLWGVAARHFRRMDQAAHAAGIDLHANSGYRSYAEQAKLYQLYLSGHGNLAASPGHSNHGWALSVDIQTAGQPSTLNWLRANASRFGFFNDVPSENWHWTYRPR